jgi:hypothetical protein
LIYRSTPRRRSDWVVPLCGMVWKFGSVGVRLTITIAEGSLFVVLRAALEMMMMRRYIELHGI